MSSARRVRDGLPTDHREAHRARDSFLAAAVVGQHPPAQPKNFSGPVQSHFVTCHPYDDLLVGKVSRLLQGLGAQVVAREVKVVVVAKDDAARALVERDPLEEFPRAQRRESSQATYRTGNINGTFVTISERER